MLNRWQSCTQPPFWFLMWTRLHVLLLVGESKARVKLRMRHDSAPWAWRRRPLFWLASRLYTAGLTWRPEWQSPPGSSRAIELTCCLTALAFLAPSRAVRGFPVFTRAFLCFQISDYARSNQGLDACRSGKHGHENLTSRQTRPRTSKTCVEIICVHTSH